MAEKIIADVLDTALARHYEQLGDAEREKQAIATVYRKSSRNRWKISHHLLLITVRYSSRTPLSLVELPAQSQSKHLSQ